MVPIPAPLDSRIVHSAAQECTAHSRHRGKRLVQMGHTARLAPPCALSVQQDTVVLTRVQIPPHAVLGHMHHLAVCSALCVHWVPVVLMPRWLPTYCVSMARTMMSSMPPHARAVQLVRGVPTLRRCQRTVLMGHSAKGGHLIAQYVLEDTAVWTKLLILCAVFQSVTLQ